MEKPTGTKPHFVLFPWTGTISHVIPMTDLGCLLASHGAEVTIITTPVNAAIAQSRVDRAPAPPHGVAITVTAIPFPAADAGLPEGCERLDLIKSTADVPRFFAANEAHGEAVARHCLGLRRRPSCVVSGMAQTWSLGVARDLGVRCYVFHGFGAFALLCIERLYEHRPHEAAASPDEPFDVPALPPPLGCRRLTTRQLPPHFMPPASVGGKALQGPGDAGVRRGGGRHSREHLRGAGARLRGAPRRGHRKEGVRRRVRLAVPLAEPRPSFHVRRRQAVHGLAGC
ncbi:unnamed protein product [Urochloa humidicola]